jgi:Ca2+-transporting ATPase
MTDDRADRADPGVIGDVASSAHALETTAVALALEVDPAVGLAQDEVDRRRITFGRNETEPAERGSLLGMIREAATEPFVVLLFLAGLGAVALGEVRDGLLVLLGLLPIVGADVVTEYRGDRAVEALRDASAPRARVRRSGRAGEIEAAGLVPGDVVLLRAGDVVPADLRLHRADRLLVDRSILTGESVPEPGRVEPDDAAAPLAERRSTAYAGTSVVGGRGEGIVTATGPRSEVGRIARGLSGRGRRRSPLQAELDRLIRILLVVAVGLIVVTAGLGFLRGRPAGENLLAGISAAIAAIPEEPPILLAVVLGLGAYRLLKRGVLVRRLNAEETLGAVDLIVTDKTGTLTRNRLEVVAVRTLAGPVEEPVRRLEFLTEALRAEDDAWLVAEGTEPGSFTKSLIRAVAASGGDTALARSELLGSDAMTDARPIGITRARRDGRVEELAIGAPEAVLALAAPHGDAWAGWLALIDAAAAGGERLVGVARRSGRGTAGGGSEAGAPGWTMRALVGFADQLRDGIPEAMATARDAGIQTIVVTGDHPVTASAIARAAGLGIGRLALGDEVAEWSDDELRAALPSLSVVARSTPEQKERLVRVARAAGRTVAVTGDGVNDAPALNRADVAVAMGSGTAVAREAADLVLGDDSFATLMYALREGRRMVDNVQKGLVFLVSTHVALLGFILIATLYGFGQPLLPIQILWLELFIDLSTSVAFEREPGEPDLMRRPPRPPGRPLLTAGVLTRIVGAGGFSAVAALLIMVAHGGPIEKARWLAFTVLVCGQVVRAYANRSLRSPIHRLGTNWFLLAAGIVVLVVQALIPLVPPLAEAFQATPLEPGDWLLVAVVALAPAVVAEIIRSVRRGVWVA